MVRGLRRRPAERHAAAAGAGPGHLQFRHALPPDPRLFAHAQGHGFPRRLRHADPRRHRRPRDRAPAGPAATASRCGSAMPAASPPAISHMSRIAAQPGQPRAAGPGDRLCRLDRPVDRAAPPLRDVPQRRDDQSALGRFTTRAQLARQRAGRASAAGCATCSPRRSARRAARTCRPRRSRDEARNGLTLVPACQDRQPLSWIDGRLSKPALEASLSGPGRASA